MTQLLSAAGSGFEDGTVGEWTSVTPLAWTISSSTDYALSGTRSMKITQLTTPSGSLPVRAEPKTMLPGPVVIEVNEYVPGGVGLDFGDVSVLFYDASDALIGLLSDSWEEVYGWNNVVVAGTAPAGTTYGVLTISVPLGSPGDAHYLDDLLLDGVVAASGGWGVGMVRMGAN